MSDDKEFEKEELATLKATADTLGLNYSPNIGAEKLAERIKEHRKLLEEAPKAKEEDTNRMPVNQRLRKEASLLHRVIITCLDPMYKDYASQIFQVGNRVVGTFKKTVPFGVEFHVPAILLKQIESETFVKHTKVNDRTNNGVGEMKRTIVPRYGIKYLDKLSQKELDGLGAAIKASQG